MTWAQRLKRAFKIDILICADSGAAAIRAAVKKSPLLNKRIQFNSLAPTAGVGLLGAGLFADDESNALR